MSETSDVYESLPEDLTPITKQGGRGPAAPRLEVRIGTAGIRLTRAAYAAIGSPQHVDILLGQATRMVAIRPTENADAFTVSVAQYTIQIQRRSLRASLMLAPLPKGTTLRFPAQLVEGALLIGPLPEASRE